jgi:arylsulfatase
VRSSLISRRGPRARLAASALALAALVPLACGRDRERPNVLLVTFDALRQDHLSYNGYPGATSPTIDALARDGQLFPAIVPTSCSTKASLTSLFTSLDYSAHRIIEHAAVLEPEFETLAETFRANGYATAGLVATPHLSGSLGYGQGFDEYLDFRRRRIKYLSAEVVGEWARSLVTKLSSDERPFFLYVHFEEPHPPWRRDEARPAESPGKKPGRERARKSFFDAGCGYLPAPEEIDALTPEKRQALIALYDDAIRQGDRELGRLLDALRAGGELEHTVVGVGTDHGIELLDRYSASHGFNPFDEVLKTAFVLYDGRVGDRGKGEVHDRQGRIFDLGPTLLAAAGLTAPPGLDGVDLLSQVGAPPIAFSTCYGFEAVRTRQFKLLHFEFDAARRWTGSVRPPGGFPDGYRLYDLRADPGERVEVGASHPEVRDRLVAELERYRKRPRSVAGEAKELPESERSKEELERLRALGYIG